MYNLKEILFLGEKMFLNMEMLMCPFPAML